MTEIYQILLIFLAIILVFVSFIITYVLIYYKKLKKHEEEKQIMSDKFSRELLQSQLEIQEQTFKNISQEIHDNIGQMLSLAKLNLNRMDPLNKEDLVQRIHDSKDLLGKAIQDLRDLAKSMNADHITSMGLTRAIEYELDLIQKAGSHQTSLTLSGTVQRLDPKKELILFRIIQETLNNIIKHADAGTIAISATYLENILSLEIADNGQGFETADFQEVNHGETGLGIRNMRNRALLIGAEFEINSNPGKGTTTTIIIPLH